eukprot:718139-Karenia_brevis.AAC.1
MVPRVNHIAPKGIEEASLGLLGLQRARSGRPATSVFGIAMLSLAWNKSYPAPKTSNSRTGKRDHNPEM